jgi:hypothetical protein
VLTFNAHAFTEYPTVAGHQEQPRIIATGTVLGGHKTPLEGQDSQQFVGDVNDTTARSFNVRCAYDGRQVGVGRVVTDSSSTISLTLT